MTRSLSTTYATVASSLALLVALGGTSYAITQIGTAQLKNNAVTTPKIKNGAVTGAKVKDRALTGADLKDGSITGADVTESSLAKVPAAATADALTGGARVTTINHKSGDVTDATLATFGDLTLLISCSGGLETLKATTTTMDNEIGVQSIESDNVDQLSDIGGDIDDDFKPGDTFVFPIGTTGNRTDRQYTFTFTAANGRGVTGHITTEDEHLGANNCLATGYLIG